MGNHLILMKSNCLCHQLAPFLDLMLNCEKSDEFDEELPATN